MGLAWTGNSTTCMISSSLGGQSAYQRPVSSPAYSDYMRAPDFGEIATCAVSSAALGLRKSRKRLSQQLPAQFRANGAMATPGEDLRSPNCTCRKAAEKDRSRQRPHSYAQRDPAKVSFTYFSTRSYTISVLGVGLYASR